MSEIRQIAIVGAGTIGASWAALFLAKGFEVIATDINPDGEKSLRSMVDSCWPALETLGQVQAHPHPRLRFERSLAVACRDADFIQESAIEREPIKVELFAEMDAATRPDVLIASSSSALTVSAMQAKCRNPERVVLGHPFNPPHLMPLVEVVGGEKTSPEAVDRAMKFYAKIGKTPIRLAREVYGHVANRLQAAVFREAVHLFESGVATLGDIDKAMTDGPGLRWAFMGPFLTYHLAGGQGGMGSFMRQFAPMQNRLWRELGTPRMDEPLQASVTDGVLAEVGGETLDELAAERDRRLLALLMARQYLSRDAGGALPSTI